MIRTFTAILFCFSLATAEEAIRLAPGHQKVISAPGVTRAAIGNPEIADVKSLPESKQVMVMARREGSTDLILWFRDSTKKTYSIQVAAGGLDVESEVRKLLKGVEGIEIRKTAGRVVIDGQIFRGPDLDRIQRVLDLYPSVRNFSHVNSGALKFIAGQITSALQEAGIGQVTVRTAGETLFLEGTVGSKSEAVRTEQIAKSIYSRLENDVKIGVEIQPLILVDMKLMEVKSNSLGQVGIKWPASIDVTGSGMIGAGGFSGMVNIGQGASVSLRALIEHGEAKILSNPKLLCRSGTPASFLAGGEIPIRLVGERTAQVMFKEYGVSLEITARTDATRRVELEINAGISDLDSASSVDGIPGILSHKVRTAANLRIGETIALAGLIENRQRKNIQKVPLLGHIPIIGELFKSRDFQKNRSDFLVFLTPLEGSPYGAQHVKEVRRMENKMDEAQKKVNLSILD
jgi:pilus assembly protein CpaC